MSARWHATSGARRGATLGGVAGRVSQGPLGAGQHAVVGGGDGPVGGLLRGLHELRLDRGRVDTLVVEELLDFFCNLQIANDLKQHRLYLILNTKYSEN